MADSSRRARRLPAPRPQKPSSSRTPPTSRSSANRPAHLDIPAKCTGAAQFGLDVRLPGMVYAVIARCPTFGGTPARFDASKALATPGVLQVFEIPARDFRVFTAGGVVVVAKSTWAAIQGRKALDINWNPGPTHRRKHRLPPRRATARRCSPNRPHGPTPATSPILGDVTASKRVESRLRVSLLRARHAWNQ